jgi:hypothetical protein
MKRNVLALAVVVLALGIGFPVSAWKSLGWVRHNLIAAPVPVYSAVERTVWLNQNWTSEKRNWFHHADQGTQTFHIPYEWLVALDQPASSLSFAIDGLLSDPLYLDRYGFIPASPQAGRTDLPVGFAHGGEMRLEDGTVWLNPATHQPTTRVGLTCAACHTGRLTFHNTALLIDGGAALIDVFKFQTAVGVALADTQLSATLHSSRFGNFAERVLGPGADGDATSELKNQLAQVVSKYKHVKILEDGFSDRGVEEGYARLDALSRIGNAVFAIDANRDDNYAAHSAPVHYPHIWDSSWFEWVQYNGSIRQPMVRNGGEALGVFAWLDLSGQNQKLFSSSVQPQTLFEMEQLLAGQPPDAINGFTGLNSPKWPEGILPSIDKPLAARGEALYKEVCQSCHLAPITSPAFWASERWIPPNKAGERHLNLELVPIAHVGTDPAQATDMQRRHVAISPALRIDTDKFGDALGKVVELTINRWYDDQNAPTSADRRDEMNGRRPNGIQAELAYKVRPLNGIWATPPYLHNGSVPNLYALLSPVVERPLKFYLGNREFDPVNVGYRIDKLAGGFELDTSRPGNRNTGHEFSNEHGKGGVIGRLLTPGERRSLIEYLKTL